jgi:D-alanyl-D-alanine dipeptidase
MPRRNAEVCLPYFDGRHHLDCFSALRCRLCHKAFRALALLPIFLTISVVGEPADPAPSPYKKLILEARQALVVTTPDWNSVNGTLVYFERASKTWRQVGEAISVVVGHKGLGWDGVTAVDAIDTEFLKKEGDGRSPAGIFRLTREFGFDVRPATSRMPYLQLTSQTECVDDVNSKFYNTVVSRNQVADVDWKSSEKMRNMKQYKLGIIVEYNPGNHKDAGSCIFLHVWSGVGIGTAGCTALEPVRLSEIARSLDEAKHPILIQLPVSTYNGLRETWRLP